MPDLLQGWIKNIDLAILPFDENILTPTIQQSPLSPNWGNVFQHLLQWCRAHSVPVIGLCHGTVPRRRRFSTGLHEDWRKVDEDVVRQFRVLLKGVPVVCNSKQAFLEWGFEGKAIIHGFNSREYPIGARQPGILTTAINIRINNYCQGGWILEACAKKVPLNLLSEDPQLGKDTPYSIVKAGNPGAVLSGFFRKRLPRLEKWLWARRKFAAYKREIGNYSIYLNTTQFSAMPRSRAEAMLCGLTVVTTPYYDIEEYIEHGKSGFLFREPDEAVTILNYLRQHPEACRLIGLASRELAQKVFKLNRYLAEWRTLIGEI